MTAKIKVGKKTYKKTCKITVKKASKVNVTPVPAKTDAAKATATPANNNNNNGGSTATATPKPTEAPVSVIKTEAGTYTVDESATYNVPLTELNETTFTCDAKRSDGETVKDGTLYNKDGSVTFTSTKDYNSGVSYYINPATKDDDIIDISDTRGEGFMGYDNGTKDMSAYDYVRVKVTSENEMNCRTYNGNDQLRSAGFPGSSSSETYEGGWTHTDDEIWEAESTFTAGNTVKAAYKTRTVFIPISMLMGKGMNPETLTAIAFCPQSSGVEVTIHRIDFVKVKYDKLVTGIDVKAAKTEIAPGKTTTVTATVTPADATRQIVKWTSSNEDVATVNFNGTVVAKKGAEGTTTITATSTDGSKVTGSVDITVKEPSEEPTVIKSHNVDLTKVVGKTNPGAGDSIAATQTAASIDFMTGGSMLYVDMSEYLATNDLDLSDYDQIKVTYQLKNQDGSDASEYTTAPSWGNFALVTKNDLNGYTNPGVLAGTIGNKIADTAVFDLSKADAAGLGTAAGFNFQLPAMDADKYISITGITLYKDNNAYVDLTKVVGKTNPGAGDSIAATQTAAGIDFMVGGSMLYVDMSEYLVANDLDLSDYAEVQVTYQLKNQDGSDASEYTTAPSWGNFALVTKNDLNGYTNPGVLAGTIGNKIADTAVFDLSKADAAGLGTAAGFNFQLPAMDADKYLSITKIVLVSK